MKKESTCHHKPCGQGIHRRDLLKLAVAAGTGLLAAGCGAGRESTASTGIRSAPVKTETAAPATEDFSRMAYCGIRCQTACPEHAYPDHCDGCKSKGGKLGPYCGVCAIRKCADRKKVLTCAHCDEYPSCSADTWKVYPILREKIDKIREGLQT